jgi:hypothetical protein
VLCHPWSITSEDPPPLITKMRATTLHHIGVVGEPIVLQTVVSSVVEWVLECSPGEASQVEVMGKLAAKFQGLEETCSWLEGLARRSVACS